MDCLKNTQLYFELQAQDLSLNQDIKVWTIFAWEKKLGPAAGL